MDKTTLILILAAFAAHFLWGIVEARRLDSAIQTLRASGQPFLSEDFERLAPQANSAGEIAAAIALIKRG